ncbi:MAG TPA: hypothetical protein VHJ82_08430 [Actinomycetota bacterium]|nr:hypothetical protein [Actinomycetota bacterium]
MGIELTDTAAHILATHLSESLLPSGSGLRIWANHIEGDGRVQLRWGFVEGPTPADEVIEEHAARIFVDREVVPLLAGKTIALHRDDERLGLVLIDAWTDDSDLPF